MLLTLLQALALAQTKYGKSPALATLKAACQEGRLAAEKAVIEGTNIAIWQVSEQALEAYLADFAPGGRFKRGNTIKTGTVQSAETRAKISKGRTKKPTNH